MLQLLQAGLECEGSWDSLGRLWEVGEGVAAE